VKVVRAVPTETISEKLSVQRLSEALGVRHLRANVFTPAEGSMSRLVGEREALAVPAQAWHRVANIGVGPLTFYVVAAPPAEGDAEVAG
jgi:hypothetical protein